jgi:hypothetical protein
VNRQLQLNPTDLLRAASARVPDNLRQNIVVIGRSIRLSLSSVRQCRRQPKHRNPASRRVRCAAVSSRSIYAASAGCGLSWPIFSKSSKLTGFSYQKDLWLDRNPRHEAVAFL